MMVEQSDMRDSVLRALSDSFERKIVCATITSAKSIEQISRENEIPVSTCYRRAHELVDLHMLRIEQTIVTNSGKKYETFRSNLKGAKITLTGGELSVDVEMNPPCAENELHIMWNSIKEGSSKTARLTGDSALSMKTE
jgi:hypothetical protein